MSAYEKIQELVEFTPYSNYISINCPLPNHPDAKPSCFVYEDADKVDGKGRFYCTGCGRGGTHEYLLHILTGSGRFTSTISTRKEDKFLPDWKKWQQRYGSLENVVQHAHENVTSQMRGDWYFKKRDLMDVYEPCKLGYLDEWAIFPIFSMDGRIIDAVCRDSKGRSKYIIHPDNDRETPNLYVPSWKLVTQSQLVYIVYGIVDALALELCGLPVITGSTGKSLSDRLLANLGKRFVIIPDKGEQDAARKLAISLGNFTHILELPYSDDEKDPDDIRMRRSRNALKELISF